MGIQYWRSTSYVVVSVSDAIVILNNVATMNVNTAVAEPSRATFGQVLV